MSTKTTDDDQATMTTTQFRIEAVERAMLAATLAPADRFALGAAAAFKASLAEQHARTVAPPAVAPNPESIRRTVVSAVARDEMIAARAEDPSLEKNWYLLREEYKRRVAAKNLAVAEHFARRAPSGARPYGPATDLSVRRM